MHIMSTNFAETLVWKHGNDVTNSAHQIQMTTIWPSHETKTLPWKFSAYATDWNHHTFIHCSLCLFLGKMWRHKRLFSELLAAFQNSLAPSKLNIKKPAYYYSFFALKWYVTILMPIYAMQLVSNYFFAPMEPKNIFWNELLGYFVVLTEFGVDFFKYFRVKAGAGFLQRNRNGVQIHYVACSSLMM